MNNIWAEKAIEIFLMGAAYGSSPVLLSFAPVILPFIAAARRTFKEGLWAMLDFYIGLVSAFIVIGALFGHFGFWIQDIMLLATYVKGIWAVAGALLIVLGTLTAVGPGIKWTRVPHIMLVGDSSITMFIFGVLAGITPSLQVLSAMAKIAVLSTNPSIGGGYAILFGLGAVVSPMTLVGSVLPVIPGAFKENPMIRYYEIAFGALIALLGAYYLTWAL